MKVCCCSRSYARMLQSGALTQLEWLDLCAADLKVDGVEYGAAHFPRTDGDYLAQLNKLCVDRGLTPASLSADLAFGEGDVDRQAAAVDAWLGRAQALGAPLLRISCGVAIGSPGVAWRELIRGLKTACAAAKDRNVTIALEAVEGTLTSTPAEMKRALKECDSAWLRVAAETSQLAGPLVQEWMDLTDAVVLVVEHGRADARAAFDVLRERGYIGFISLEYDGENEAAEAARLVASLRIQCSGRPTADRA